MAAVALGQWKCKFCKSTRAAGVLGLLERYGSGSTRAAGVLELLERYGRRGQYGKAVGILGQWEHCGSIWAAGVLGQKECQGSARAVGALGLREC